MWKVVIVEICKKHFSGCNFGHRTRFVKSRINGCNCWGFRNSTKTTWTSSDVQIKVLFVSTKKLNFREFRNRTLRWENLKFWKKNWVLSGKIGNCKTFQNLGKTEFFGNKESISRPMKMWKENFQRDRQRIRFEENVLKTGTVFYAVGDEIVTFPTVPGWKENLTSGWKNSKSSKPRFLYDLFNSVNRYF